MKHFLIDQKRLHRKALEVIYEIECVRDLFRGFDQEYKERRIAEKMKEYYEIIDKLNQSIIKNETSCQSTQQTPEQKEN